MRKMLFAAVVSTVMLAGCTTAPTLSREERTALYFRHAGDPIPSFRLDRFVRRTDWTPLNDQALVVWNSHSRGHLLEFRSRCPGLSFAQNISITNSFGTVNARFDSVIPRSAAGTPGSSCRITRIRPLDGRGIREERREIREGEYVDRPEGVQPEPEDDAPGADTTH